MLCDFPFESMEKGFSRTVRFFSRRDRIRGITFCAFLEAGKRFFEDSSIFFHVEIVYAVSHFVLSWRLEKGFSRTVRFFSRRDCIHGIIFCAFLKAHQTVQRATFLDLVDDISFLCHE